MVSAALSLLFSAFLRKLFDFCGLQRPIEHGQLVDLALPVAWATREMAVPAASVSQPMPRLVIGGLGKTPLQGRRPHFLAVVVQSQHEPVGNEGNVLPTIRGKPFGSRLINRYHSAVTLPNGNHQATIGRTQIEAKLPEKVLSAWRCRNPNWRQSPPSRAAAGTRQRPKPRRSTDHFPPWDNRAR